MMRDRYSYFMRLAIAFDALGNAIIGGNIGMTISAHADASRAAGKRWGVWLANTLDFVFANHCANALSNARLYAQYNLDWIDGEIKARYL